MYRNTGVGYKEEGSRFKTRDGCKTHTDWTANKPAKTRGFFFSVFERNHPLLCNRKRSGGASFGAINLFSI